MTAAPDAGGTPRAPSDLAPAAAFWRVSLAYGALFFGIGATLQFFPAWLAGRGLSAETIGLLLATATIVRTVSAPVVGFLADRSGRRVPTVRYLAFASAAVLCLYIPDFGAGVFGVAVIVTVAVLNAVLTAGKLPIVEAVGLGTAERYGLDYGRMRLWGSVSFIIAGYGFGVLADRTSLEALPVWQVLTGLALGFVCFLLPRGVVRTGTFVPPTLGDAVALLANRPLVKVMLGTGLVQASHAAYYALGTVHWLARGLDAQSIAVLWAVGVIAEIVLFALRGSWLPQGVWGLGLIGAFGGVLRWGVTACEPGIAGLSAAQTLHALTFAAIHLAAMRAIHAMVDPALGATAQTMLTAIHGGLLMAPALALAGWLYDGSAWSIFVPMAAMCATGAGLMAVARLLSRNA